MGIASGLREYLSSLGVRYELLPHDPTSTSTQTAEAAHVPGDKLAKPVVIKDAERYRVVLIPSTRRLDFTALHHALGRQVGLAIEEEVEALFADCTPGAVPAPAQAYGVTVLIDRTLLSLDEVYFEAGDHASLIRMGGEVFRSLMADARTGDFTEPMANYGEGRRRQT